MDELVVGKMYYVSDAGINAAEFKRSMKVKECLCKCTSKRGKFKVREGVYRYMNYWVAEKEAKMKKRISDTQVANYLEMYKDVPYTYIGDIMLDLQDARKELEEAEKDSVWWDAPEDAAFASVHHCITSGQPYAPDVAHFYYRILPKTPKQELIDSFAEKNALAMKCSGLNKELLEAFYEEVKK